MYSMHDIRDFLAGQMPATKLIVENLWKDNRAELGKFLEEYLNYLSITPHKDYLADLHFFTRTAPHTYTNPWDVL